MPQKTKSILLQVLPIILATFLVMAIIYAWVEPTAPPPGGNVPAPLNVGNITQWRQGGLGLGAATGPLLDPGVISATRLIDTDNSNYYIDPSGILGISAILSGNVGIGTTAPGSKLEVSGSFRVTGTSSYIKLPLLTTAQRDALSPETGMIIYNASTFQVEWYVPGGWSYSAGAPRANGVACGSGPDCASGWCVDGYCCNSACSGDCEGCNVPGHIGTCTVRPADDNSECSPCHRCNGSSTTSIAQSDNEGYNCTGDCTHCVSGSCVNWPDNEQHEGCTALCKSCISGSCQNTPNGTDPNNECGGSSCCGYCNGGGNCIYVAGGSTCSSPGDSCTATHYRCDGGGSCTAPKTYADLPCFHGATDLGDTCCVNAGYDDCDGVISYAYSESCGGDGVGPDHWCCDHICSTFCSQAGRSCKFRCYNWVYD